MTTSKRFHLGHLITGATGIFVGPGNFDDFQGLAEHLAGGPVWTHQMPSAMDALKPCLIGQHPWLADIKPPEFGGADVQADVAAWLAEQVERYGAEHEVTVCEGGWGSDPITDLAEMVGPDRVVPVIVD
jgi:hypothetical protein